MPKPIVGLHHVTTIASDPQRNLDFYTELLGLRLIKRTVNFDDPGTYHFYFGDQRGTPGTILTFFPWPTAPPGRAGTGQSSGVSFAVPSKALHTWIARLKSANVSVNGPFARCGEQYIHFLDPHG